MDDFLNDLASDAPSPGAGAAACVALALACACLQKACAITLKHEEGVAIEEGRAELAALRREALSGAKEDGDAFEALLAAKGEAREAAQSRLAEAVRKMLRLAARVEALAAALTPQIDPVMAGDVAAAKALAQAGAAIHRRNLDEDEALAVQ